MTPDTDNEFSSNVFNSFMDLFFQPEITRRKALGILVEPFTLVAAQVIFFPDGRQPTIRLNEEVRAEIKLKKGLDPDQKDFWATRNDVKSLKLNESDLQDCGHATLILLKDGYQLTFDFVYNKAISTSHLKVAEEFLKTAKFALDNNLRSSFIDNSFSAAELLAKANLLLETNGNIQGKTNHKAIKSEFNKRHKNTTDEFNKSIKDTFNQLSDYRSKVRYLNADVDFSNFDMKGIYDILEKLHNDLMQRVGPID